MEATSLNLEDKAMSTTYLERKVAIKNISSRTGENYVQSYLIDPWFHEVAIHISKNMTRFLAPTAKAQSLVLVLRIKRIGIKC